MSPAVRFASVAAIALTTLALSTLSAADPPEEVAKLIAQLKDPNEAVRLKAAKELGKFKEKAQPAMELLGKVASSDPDEDVRAVAKKSLAAIREAVGVVEKEKDKEAVAPLLKKLKSKKAVDRQSALEELTKLGEKGRPAASAVIEAMLDPSPTVREAAAGCLEKVDPAIHKHVVSILYDKDRSQRAYAVAELAKLGPRAKNTVPVLKHLYASNSAKNRYPDSHTLGALVTIVPDDALIVQEVLTLVAATKSPDRDTGLRLLDQIETTKKKKIDALTAALNDEYYRVMVINRLAKFGPDAKAALPALMKLKLDSAAAVRDAATKAVETITAE